MGTPGPDAQHKMAPITRKEQLKLFKKDQTTRKAAVLILLYQWKNDIYIPFIKRPEYDGVHSGQIAFPGGKREDFDSDIIETAYREAYEETGITNANYIGKLSNLFVPPSNFDVTPVIAYSENKPDFKTDPVEVAELYNFPVEELINPANRQSFQLELPKRLKYEAPCFNIQGQVIWGATAMILMELVELLHKIITPGQSHE